MGLPEFVASIGLQPVDTGLSALAPLDHALDCLQPVKIIASHATVADGEGFFGGSTERELYRRDSPGDSQAGATLKRKAQLVRNIDHLPGPVPIPRELLVVEIRDRAAAGAEYFGDLFEELVMRAHHDA